MSGRPRRGPGRPRIVDTGMSPTRCIPPASPLTPDSEEGFIVNEPKSRRGRPKGPQKKTRVNAQSKLKSPIRASQSASNVDSSKAECNYEFKKEAVDAMGQPVVPEGVLRDEIVPEDKLCAFCSCGPERRMYQGKLQLCAPTPGFNPFKKVSQNRQRQNSTPEPFEPGDTGKEAIDDVPQPQPMVHRRGPGRPPGRGRKKGSVVIGLPFRNNGHSLTADKCMFGSIRERDVTEVFENDGSVWAHHCCASWSDDVCQLDSYDFVNVDKAVYASLTERCAHCTRYGASVVCQVPKCNKTFHYPCAASAGAFQEIQSMTMLCPDHVEDAGRLGGVEAQCYMCGEAKDFSEMLFCTSCGRHCHGRCLDPAVDPTSLVRMSWQCPDCKVCQGCRQPGDDNKMLVCDVCDKGYHTYCLDPPMTTIPKTGWKCVGCRRCEDCGSNTPGGGPTSRWHRHYTVCDSCYQQRNKGLFCQICSRAYRQLSDVAMVQCVACEKWLHAECDNVPEDTYRKITAKKLNYFCPQCKENGEDHALINHKNSSLSFDTSSINDVDPPLSAGIDEDKRTLTSAAIGRITPSPMDEDLTLIHANINNSIDDLPELRPFEETLMDSLDSDSKLQIEEEMESVMKPDLDMFDTNSSLPDSPPTSDHNFEPKPLASTSYRSLGFTPPKSGGKRKLGPRLKSKGSTPARKKVKHGRPGRPPSKFKKQASVQPSPGKENVSSVANVADTSTKDEEPEGLHTTVVLFSSNDKFTSEQDMCLCCGSFGKGREGQLIACSQCGQSYHPYCVGVKVNKIILEKGWRCLDCTLCEGCGKGSDEARLLLCDSCDISYHTYCLDPPLEKVPQGGWKCKWCVSCYECGNKTPGSECEWQSNYTQCGPCASKITCPVCNIKYNENDLMIQCLHCDRWLHGSCDKLLTEEEVDKAAEYGYHCLFCRPKTKRALVCLSGPPSPRATALHHYRPQFSNENHPPQPQAKPIHPCQRLTNNGIVEMKLSHDYGRGGLLGGSQSLPEIDNSFLTDSGIKQMNRLKLTAYGRKKVKVKREKTKKMGLAGLDKMNILSPDGQANPLNAFNFNAGAIEPKTEFDHKPGRSKNALRPGVGGFIVKGRGSGARKYGGRGRVPGRKKGFGRGRQSAHIGTNLPNFFAQQQSSLEAIMDSSSNEAWPDDLDMTHSTPLQDTYPEWMQEAFFGKGLLNIHSKKRKARHESATSASENEKDSKDNTSTDKNPTNSQPGQYNPFSNDMGPDGQLQPQPGHPGQQQGDFARPDQPGTSVMGLEGSENWHGSNVEGLPADPLSLSEEFPNPDVLYRSLDMLGDDMSSADCQNVNREQEQAHIQGPPAQTSNTNNNTTSQPQQGLLQPANRTQGDLDLLSVSLDPLPHVNCQEVEDIFADLELELEQRELYSGIGPNQSGMSQPVPRPGNEPPRGHHPPPPPPPPPPYQPPHQDMQGFPPGNHPQGMEPTMGHFDTSAAPGFPQFGQDRDNFRRNQQAPIGAGPYGFDAEHDFAKRTDLDLASDLPRERRRAPSPRTDPMKQQQKWQEDEKLGDTATISPVLYANLEHPDLQKEYPDWPNRYRAIARLWRKLSVEQREPYRLKARDNRVRLKDQGKRLLLEQSKEKVKSALSEVPESPASEPMTPTPLTTHVQEQPMQIEQQQPPQQQQSQNLMPQMSSDLSPEKDRQSMVQPNPGPFPGTGFLQVPPSPQFQQDQPRCPTPLTPMSMNATPPMTPTSFTPSSPMGMFAAPRMSAVSGGKSPKTSKSKKTKEDREKDKEKRKQKLMIQQQQEREWKMLQQRRQLEQQRQQQQSQQETNLLRQEVKRTQQVKGLRALDDKKKKTPPKMIRKSSLSEFSVSSGKGDDSNASVDTPQQSPAVSMHSDDSLSLMNASPLDTIDNGLVGGAMRRNSLPNLAMSQHGLENVRPLSPMAASQDRPPLVRSLSQQPSHSSWNDWSNDGSKQDHNSPMWSNAMQQPQPINDQNKANFPNPVVSRQNSRQPNDDNFMQQQGKQQLAEGTVELSFQPDQAWKPNGSQGPPLTPGLPKQTNDPNQMPPQEHSQGDMGNIPFHQQSVMNDQQSLVHKQQDMPPQWHSELHGNHPQPSPQDHMGIVQQNVPQQPPHVMAQNQGQPRLQHPDMSRQQSYEFQGWQDTSSGPTSMAFQQPQMQQAPHQQQAPMQLGPQPMPMQPMTSMSGNMQQQSQPGMSQVPIQPGPPPAPPPPPLPPPQHGPNLPMPRQPPTDDQQQQQQLEMLQKQQREQLMRAQQQQFLQMQLQQQQHLLQQQQQQQQPPQIAVQPPFARPRMNQVLNTKDMPEIESEEEHQERLRFLYRQRQIQKQHLQMQAQQNMFQQQWPAQGIMPAVMPNDPGNPQGMPPIRPQPGPDVMQQQLFMEYQRRMNQRVELGQQTIQFDKVMQDLQQQQGLPTSGPHPNPPFVEVSHQRFALRHPNPGMQNNPIGPMAPGQVPMLGMDGQQFYRMQMQQQMIMQQQTPQRMLLQKPKVQPNTAPKQSVPEKDTNALSTVQPTAKADKPAPKSSEVPEDAKADCVKLTDESNATTSENPTPVNTAEADKGESKTDTSNDCATNDNEKDTCKQQVFTDNGDIKSSEEISLTADATTEETSAENPKPSDNAQASVNNNASSSDGNGESQSESSKEPSETATAEKNSVEASKAAIAPSQVPTPSEEAVQQKVEEVAVPVSAQEPTKNQQPATARPRHQDNAVSQQMQPPPVSTPHTPSVAPSNNQQQAIQQQLVATQQRFFQMQQQRQIMMQQYQQLQQQLQQNQGDPMLGAQLMALQQQAQFLQQNMLQTWQQLQMLQQQIQTSSGFQPQQIMPQNPISGPMQGPQWQGPTQDQPLGMMPQHPGMMNKPGMMPPMPGPLMLPDGAPSPKGDKPGKKPRRSRAKSKDTLAPQSSDWMNPQPIPAKPKGKGRKGKKQDDAVQDQELQMQQQLLRQQILQGMEQRHRLLQQQQQHGPMARDNSGMLNHPEMSGSPRDLGPPTPQSLDGSTPQPMGPNPFVPSPSQSMANNPQQQNDPHFVGSPSMGIMTPEQINLSTSQLMNNALSFHGNPTPASQGNPRPPTNTSGITRSLSHPGPLPRNVRPNSQPQPFPPQERFQNFPQQQQQQHKQPVVQYVADNNPFSDDFQTPKVVTQEKTEPTKIFPKQETSEDLTVPSSKPDLSGPASSASHISTLDTQTNKTMTNTVPELPENEVKISHGELTCDTNGPNVKNEEVEAAKKNDNINNEQQGENPNVDGKKGVSSQALQKLESMVADMGSEEASNLHGEALDSDMCFDMFNTNPDEEVANLCSPRNKDQQMVSIAKSSSQTNSVASLECHEEVPSFVSPVQDVNADKADNKDSSQVNSPAAQSTENSQDSANIEPVSLASNTDPGRENSQPTSFGGGREASHSHCISTAELTSVSEQLQQSVAPLSTPPETSTVTASLVTGSDVTVSSVSSGVFGGHLQLPTEGDMGMLGNFTNQSSDTAFNIRPSNQDITNSQPDHGAMLLSGRDPMLGAANPVLSSTTSNPVMINPAPVQKSPAKQQKPKVKRARAEPRSRESIREDDIIKKSLQEARKQEYERKKREYEEQQRRKREMQKELRQQKARQKEERKRQRLLNSPNKMKSKENHVQKVRKGDNDAVSFKDSLPLCEPKLILTHALMHPYGTSPFNGQCSLKGALGNAHIDNSVDYYAKFPTPSLELVLKINQQKGLVNGDVNTHILDTKDFLKLREPDLPIKRARHMPSEMALLSTDTSSVNSLSSSPDTLQYVASSSPESDPVNKSNTPKFSALEESNRSNNDSPVFTPINPLNIKSERLLTTSSCSARSYDTTSDSRKDSQIAPPNRAGPLLGLDQDIDDLDSINVTLTLSPSSEIRVSETVASVAELIGCSPPRPSDIVIEPSWKTGGSLTTTVPTTSGSLMFPHPRTPQGLAAVLSPKEGENAQKTPYPFTQFNLSTTKSAPQRKPSDGPYCRHCDVLIIGIGVIRGPPDMTSDSSTAELREIKIENSSETEANAEGANYKMYNVNVQADERRDCFCSETCLKQYYSPLEAKTKTQNTQEQSTDSTTSEGSGNITNDADQDNRGAKQAEGLPMTSMAKIRRPSWKDEEDHSELEMKRRREIKWRRWQAVDFTQKTKQELTADEIAELLDKYDAVFKSQDLPDDTRQCTLCSGTGDGEPEGPSRLLNLDVDIWVHLNCALWSLEVYETLNGALMNVESAIKRGNVTECCVCKKTGATVVCNHVNVYNKIRCPSTYHFGCALQRKCMFFKDKTMLCEEHKPNDDSEHRLPSYAVFRKVFINRDEIQQIASMLRHNQESGGDSLQTLRIGSIVIKSLGQLLLHQLQAFHTRNAVYPVGFKTIRYYWSMDDVRKRCQYFCSVQDLNGKPNFTIRTKDNTIYSGKSPKDAWNQVLLPIQTLRKENDRLNLWPSYITGEDLFGLTEQYVLRIIESMPGVDCMQGYNMRYGPSPIMELPLAVNPTGSARSEPHIRSHFKTRTRAIRNTSGTTGSTSRPTSRATALTTQQSTDDTNSLYMKHFVHSKASQYRKLKSEWRQNVVLGRSNIQGLGLFANREIEPNSMVIEYIGSIIRNEVANRKEGIYESQNRGIYMFRIDTDAVIDATMAGGPARYINHSCMPNCVAEVVTFEKEQKIIIISNRKVERGEELTYDYKFDFEDDEHKISCLCGAPNCRKWMN